MDVRHKLKKVKTSEKIPNYLYVKDLFWIQLKKHLVTFGFKNLPSKQHFTISFNSDSDLNFHLTKNTNDQVAKPSIPLVIMNKEHFNTHFESLAMKVISCSLTQVKIEDLVKLPDLNILAPNESIKDDPLNSAIENLYDQFKDSIENKKRIKIKQGWESKITSVLSSEKTLNSICEGVSKFDRKLLEELNNCYLIDNDQVRNIFKINGLWFEFKTDLNIIELLTNIMSEKLARNICWKIKRSIVILERTESFKEVEHLRNPIRLVPYENTACA